MRLSIIVPVYNVKEYLQGCIDSILANDCSDCEIILVDDGATDGVCPALCDENAARHPDLIRVIHQENRGLGGARNTGLEAAKGEYVLFVDSDDTIAPQTLQVLTEQVEKTHADIYSFDFCSHDGQGNETVMEASAGREGVFTLAEDPDFLLSLPAAWARLWRRDLFINTGIRYPDRVWYEDIRTTTKLFAAASSIVVLKQPLYYYLARPGSIMRSGNLLRCREILDAFDDILQWFEGHGLLERYYKELCRLAVDHIRLAASIRVIRQDPHSPLVKEFAHYMHVHFPDWKKNPYLADLPRKHKLLLWLMDRKWHTLIALLFRLGGSK
ncbi:MAG: glycosyltransferase [Oscillospiraceae bacterium]|nr:glycosyltransferase [Oscillospiraceae bacterium]